MLDLQLRSDPSPCNFGDLQNPRPHENLLFVLYLPSNHVWFEPCPISKCFLIYGVFGALYRTKGSYQFENTRCTMFECVFLWKVKRLDMRRKKECTLLDIHCGLTLSHCFRHRIFQCCTQTLSTIPVNCKNKKNQFFNAVFLS